MASLLQTSLEKGFFCHRHKHAVKREGSMGQWPGRVQLWYLLFLVFFLGLCLDCSRKISRNLHIELHCSLSISPSTVFILHRKLWQPFETYLGILQQKNFKSLNESTWYDQTLPWNLLLFKLFTISTFLLFHRWRANKSRQETSRS